MRFPTHKVSSGQEKEYGWRDDLFFPQSRNCFPHTNSAYHLIRLKHFLCSSDPPIDYDIRSLPIIPFSCSLLPDAPHHTGAQKWILLSIALQGGRAHASVPSGRDSASKSYQAISKPTSAPTWLAATISFLLATTTYYSILRG